MKQMNVYLLDINSTEDITGVSRYLHVLQEGLRHYTSVRVCRIVFQFSPRVTFVSIKELPEGKRQVIIPLPQHPDGTMNEPFWMEQYNKLAFGLIKQVFVDDGWHILHLHTLNLIDFALLVKKQVPNCRIVTHLHCIPWKGLCNRDRQRFNRLYKQFCIDGMQQQKASMAMSCHNELKAYEEADHIVCVTENGHRFITSLLGENVNVSVIYNGMPDLNLNDNACRRNDNQRVPFRLLYVGSISPSKGLVYILQALRMLQTEGYCLSLTVAGRGQSNYLETLRKEYADVEADFVGRISLAELKEYYQTCDVGVIASLQEQCSYVAIEMAMFALPIVTTGIDGLDEMFADEVNALKVPVNFSETEGLAVDVIRLKEQIKRLINNPLLRMKLEQNARKLYEEKFCLNTMVKKTLGIYQKVTMK